MQRKYYSKKYNEDAMIIESEVLEIIEKNKVCNNRFKNVFTCRSSKGTPRMCVLWGQSNIEEGNKVEMKGRLNGDVFLCWSLYIKDGYI